MLLVDERSLPPLPKGRWHGEAVTEGFIAQWAICRFQRHNHPVSFADSPL